MTEWHPSADGITELPWRDRAACRHQEATLFFPLSDTDEAVVEAVAVCDRCLVEPECLVYALGTRQQFGVWGGTTADERRRLARRLGIIGPRSPMGKLVPDAGHTPDRSHPLL